MTKTSFLTLALILFALLLNGQTTIYVKHDATGNGDGTSWADAYTDLEEAINQASDGTAIWVAAGTYTPTTERGGDGDDRFKAFKMKHGVAIYGGFAGAEDPGFELDDRDFDVNETILSGDLGGGVNVYHVFRHVNLGLSSTAILDGFTISGGIADGSDPENKGGGMLNSGSSVANGSSPTIRNCVFKNNEATQGGAMFNSRYCNPAVVNTIFQNNTASDIGGAVYLARNTTTFDRCTFQNNSAQATGANQGGGAVYITTSASTEGTTFTNCSFIGNTVNKPSTGARGGAIHALINPGFLTINGSNFQDNEAQHGGAVYHSSGSDTNRDASTVKISNSTFEQNTAEYGGAILSDRHNTIVTSCIIRGNEATEQSGGFYGRNASSKLINTLVSGNKSGKHGGGVYFNAESPEIINSTITGNYSGERGGGVSIIGTSTLTFNNSILYGNDSPEGNELWVCATCIANIDYSLYGNGTNDVFITNEGEVNATNSLNDNPEFLNPYDPPTNSNTPNILGNYFICGCTSPAIDAGLNNHVPEGVTEDLRGNDRILDGNGNGDAVVDLGAYEFDPNGCNALAPFAGDGSAGNPYEISMLQHLYWIAVDPARWGYHYIQIADIDACNTETWFGGQGWTPIGNATTPFIGSYDGGGHTISNLQINRTSEELGLFGRLGESFGADKGNVINLNLIDVDINGEDNYIGGLAGYQEGSSAIENVHVTGEIKGRVAAGSGSRHIGGIAGESRGSVTNCSFIGTVRGHGYIGGLIGESRGQVSNSFTSGTVETNKDFSGGLIGRVSDGGVTKSYSTADITTLATYVYYAGGLIGDIFLGTVNECYSTGHVSGLRNQAGGFVGRNRGVITNCFARGSVSRNGGGGADFGGFVGWNERGKVINCYSTGKVEWESAPHPNDKGFAGNITTGLIYEMTGNFWDTETSGQATTSGNATGETTKNMTTQSTFTDADWDFATIWAMNASVNDGYPHFSFNLFTWSGTENTDWGNANNWNQTTTPVTGANILIPGALTNNPVLDSDRSVGNLSIAADARLTIPPGTALTVNGELINDAGPSGLLIQSSAAGTGSLIHNSEGVEATVERYIAAAVWSDGTDGWHFLSAPVAGQLIEGIWTPDGNSNNDYDFYAWSEEHPGVWLNQKVAVNNINEFVPGVGYLVAYQQNTTGVFSNTLNVGTVNVTLKYTGTLDKWEYQPGWNLLGNPYASGIDWNKADRQQFEDDFAYIYNTDKGDGAGGYDEIDGGDFNAYIAAHQGFFVKVKSDAHAADFVFENATRVHQGSYLKSPKYSDKLVLRLANNDYYDQTVIRTISWSSFDRDRRDALKMFSFNPEVPQVYSYTADQIRVAINSIPHIDKEQQINLGLRIPTNGEYILSLQEISGVFSANTLLLEDTKTNTIHDLQSYPEFRFQAAGGDMEGRFVLHFSPPEDDDPVNIQEKPDQATARMWYHNNHLYIQTTETGTHLTIYNLNGHVLQTHQPEPGLQSYHIKLPPGVYIARLNGNKTFETLKIITTNTP